MKHTSKYNLVSTTDGNDTTELDAQTFQDAVEEAFDIVQWYMIDEGDCYVAVNLADPNDTIELHEGEFEDAQYEALETLGYFISSNVD